MRTAIFFIFTTLHVSLYAQWSTETGQNEFDGSYKLAKAIGKGGRYPFNKPELIIRKYKDKDPEIILSKIGYTGCQRNTIRVVFDTEEDILICNDPIGSMNDESLFITLFSNISLYDFYQLLSEKSKIHIRHTSSCGLSEMTFGLIGSSKALDFVLDGYYVE